MLRLLIPLPHLRPDIISTLHRRLLSGRPISNAKQLIHVLKRDTLCLGHEEPDKDKHAEAEAAKNKVGAVTVSADCDQHSRHGAGHDEIEQPLRRGGVGYVEGAQAGGGDFRGVDPAGRTPAKLEETVKRYRRLLAYK